MTVTEYREKHPNCEYCYHSPAIKVNNKCDATGKRVSNRTAKKCPCYVARRWAFDKNASLYGGKPTEGV